MKKIITLSLIFLSSALNIDASEQKPNIDTSEQKASTNTFKQKASDLFKTTLEGKKGQATLNVLKKSRNIFATLGFITFGTALVAHEQIAQLGNVQKEREQIFELRAANGALYSYINKIKEAHNQEVAAANKETKQVLKELEKQRQAALKLQAILEKDIITKPTSSSPQKSNLPQKDVSVQKHKSSSPAWFSSEWWNTDIK